MNFSKTSSKNPSSESTIWAFSLVEVMVAMFVLTIMMGFFAVMVDSAADTWTRGERRVETYQAGRATLELIGRESKSAVTDSRMQFAIFDGEELETKTFVDPSYIMDGSPAMFFMSPLSANGELSEVGYYLTADYKLKRIVVEKGEAQFPSVYQKGNNDPTSEFYSATVLESDDPEGKRRPHALYVNWLLANLDYVAFDDRSVSSVPTALCSTLADGVLGFWVQAIDTQGNPIPKPEAPHPVVQQPIHFNSAGFWMQSTAGAFDTAGGTDPRTFLFMDENRRFWSGNINHNRPTAPRAHRVPAGLDVTLLVVDEDSLWRLNSIPTMAASEVTGSRAGYSSMLDIEASANQMIAALEAENVRDYRVFSTRIKLLNGGK